MSKYGLIKADEDGNTFRVLNDGDLEDLLSDAQGNYGVRDFVGIEDIPEYGVQYLGEDAILIKFEVLRPKEVTKAWSL